MPSGQPTEGHTGPAGSGPSAACGRWWPAAVALLLLPSLAAAQMLQATATANAGLLRPGETFEVTVRVTQWTQEGAGGHPAEVEWPNWEKLGLTRTQGQRRHTSSRSGPGATMSVTLETIELKAGKPGTITIPPLTVRAGNDSTTTTPLTLMVDARAPVALPSSPAPSSPPPTTAPSTPAPAPPAMPSAPPAPASPGSPPWWQDPTLTTPPPMAGQSQPPAREDPMGDLQMKVGAAAGFLVLIALILAVDRARRRRAEQEAAVVGVGVADPQRPELPTGLDPATTLRMLEQLKAKDRRLSVFGAATHRYRLNPPLTDSQVAAFEAKWQVRLPDEYRLFLTQVGNGGAGPYHGLERLGEIEDEAWREEGEGQIVGDLSVPFRHQAAWNLPQSFWDDKPDWNLEREPDEEARLQEEWDTKLDTQYWEPHIMDGAIPICHAGCGQFRWLVVSGEHRGRIWADHRVDEEGVWPLVDGIGRPLTFSAWYHAWLDNALYGPAGAGDPTLRRPFRG